MLTGSTVHRGAAIILFLLLKTPMKVYQENGILITGENACILYTPGQMQHYQAVQKFRNSYLHFVAQENPAEYFQLPQNQIFYPQNPEEIEEIIRKLQQEYITRSSHTEAMQSALICQLLVTAARGLEKGSDITRKKKVVPGFSGTSHGDAPPL